MALDEDKKRSVQEFFADDPEKADKEFFGRVANPDRRGFLKRTGLATMAAMVGTSIPFHRNMPSGFIPEAIAATGMKIEGKQGLTVLNDRPVNAETPAHNLDDDVTPTARHFIRNNGIPPEDVDPSTWTLTIDGDVEREITLTFDDLLEMDLIERDITMTCVSTSVGGEFVGGARWLGVRLTDLLDMAGVGDRTGDRLADPPGGIRRELVTPLHLKLLDRGHQTNESLLHEVF